MRWRHPTPGVLAALALSLLGLSSGAAWAASGSATTTSAAPSPSTVPPSTTSSTSPLWQPPPTSGPATTTSTTTASAKHPTSTTTTTTASTTTTVAPAGQNASGTVGYVPPAVQAEIAAYRVTPPGSDKALIAALAPLKALGIGATQAALIAFGRFPVAGPTTWSDSFLQPRFSADGGLFFHHAIDIPAPCGTPLRSPDEGTLRQGSDPGGGTTVEITEPDGTYMYLAHLSGYAAGQSTGDHVRVGDLVGYMGQTGDATGCHVHLEIHPQGGDAVDPKAFVDAWYRDALAGAPLLVDALRVDKGLPPLAQAQGLQTTGEGLRTGWAVAGLGLLAVAASRRRRHANR